MHKKYPWGLLGTILVLVIVYLVTFYQLLSKSYYVDESKLYKVDTFHLLSRVYEQFDNSGSGRYSSSKPKLVFKSTNGYSFAIDKNIFQAITDKEKLKDALMYHDLEFTVYTDKEYFDKYKEADNPIFIRVYQIQIGDKKYIDVPKMNKLSKGDTLRGVIIPPAFVFYFGLLLYKEQKDEHYWNKKRTILWCIAFSMTVLGLLFLT